MPVLALVLAIYTLPSGFSYDASNLLDGSWTQVINYAVKHQFIFGSQFIFTYGPLGFLGTRYTPGVSVWVLFIVDMFNVLCFYHIFKKFLYRYAGWFPFLLIALVYFRDTDMAARLFLIFIIFSIANLKNDALNYFELAACAIAGVLVFFIKINYGMISIPLLISLCMFLLFHNRKASLILFAVSAAVFIFICTQIHIDLLNYVRYGVPIISGYGDAMVVAADVSDTPFVSAMEVLGLFVIVFMVHIWRLHKGRQLGMVHVYSIMLYSLVLFLTYKNGFTRADAHINGFFKTMPLYMCLAVYVFDISETLLAKLLCIVAVFITDKVFPLPFEHDGRQFINHAFVQPVSDYCSGALKKESHIPDPDLALPADKLKKIGRSGIDIIPIDICMLLQNNLNYQPRPAIQSYLAYTPAFDSLNANHFYQPGRPGYVLVSSWSIDNRYAQWDESITKAVLHLNYTYIDLISRNSGGKPPKDPGPLDFLMLLQSKPQVQVYPEFKQLYEQTVNLEDTTYINFPDDSAIYMTADIEYHTLGKIKNALFQPPILSVSLFLKDTSMPVTTYRVVRQQLQKPVLINKAVFNDRDFAYFLTGNIRGNKSIKAFAFHASGRGCKKQIKLAFYKMVNY